MTLSYRAIPPLTLTTLTMLALACTPDKGGESDTTTDTTAGPNTTTATEPGTTEPTTAPTTGTTTDPTTDPTTEPTTGDTTTGGATTGCERLTGTGDVAWYLRCGGPMLELVSGVAVDAAGNTFVGLDMRSLDVSAPTMFGEFEVVPGDLSDIVIVKFDPEGEVLWVKHFTGPDDEYLSMLRGCGDGVVLAGQAPPGALDLGGGPIADPHFLAALDGEGNHRWSRGVPILVEDGHLSTVDMICDADGSLALTGEYRGGIDLGGGPILPKDVYDGLVARFDPEGGLLWTHVFGTDATSFGLGTGIYYAPNGDIAVAGWFTGSVDLGAGPLEADDDEAMVMLLSGDGKPIWSRSLGEVGRQYGHAVAVDAAGQVVLGGAFLEAAVIGADDYVNTFPDADEQVDGTLYDGFLGFLSPTGDVQSSLQIGSKLNDSIYSLHFTAEGALMLTGYTEEAFTLREFVDGEPGWTWSTPHIEYGLSAANKDSISVAARVEGTFDLGAGELAPRGNQDMVLAKIRR